MKYILIIITFSLFNKSIVSQTFINLDSLLYSVVYQKEDSIKIKSYIKICNKIVFSDPNLSLEYGIKALKLSEKLKWSKGIVSSP